MKRIDTCIVCPAQWDIASVFLMCTRTYGWQAWMLGVRPGWTALSVDGQAVQTKD